MAFDATPLHTPQREVARVSLQNAFQDGRKGQEAVRLADAALLPKIPAKPKRSIQLCPQFPGCSLHMNCRFIHDIRLICRDHPMYDVDLQSTVPKSKGLSHLPLRAICYNDKNPASQQSMATCTSLGSTANLPTQTDDYKDGFDFQSSSAKPRLSAACSYTNKVQEFRDSKACAAANSPVATMAKFVPSNVTNHISPLDAPVSEPAWSSAQPPASAWCVFVPESSLNEFPKVAQAITAIPHRNVQFESAEGGLLIDEQVLDDHPELQDSIAGVPNQVLVNSFVPISSAVQAFVQVASGVQLSSTPPVQMPLPVELASGVHIPKQALTKIEPFAANKSNVATILPQNHVTERKGYVLDFLAMNNAFPPFGPHYYPTSAMPASWYNDGLDKLEASQASHAVRTSSL